MARVVIADAVAPACARRLAEAGLEAVTCARRPEVLHHLGEAEALVVRSATRVDRELLEAGPRLRAVGRAGEGVDNIDLEAATARGVLVMNTPGANTVAAAEHTLALLLALARHIPEADRSVAEGRWERGRFVGVELFGKTLGILGLGKIGREVAGRARALGMEVVGHDPFLSEEAAEQVPAELVDLAALLARADFLTVHVPLTPATRHAIGASQLAAARPGIRLLNCARGGIYDEAAVAQALREGRVAGAAFDVFETEPPAGSPLPGLPGVICTPHLGASTVEAQDGVARRIAEQIVDYLQDGVARGAVNLDPVDPALRPRLAPLQALAETLGRLLAQLQEPGLREIRAEYAGEARDLPSGPLTAALLRGYLGTVVSEPVNPVNARVLAHRLGIAVTEVRSEEPTDFASLLAVTIRGREGERRVAGTLFGRNRPRIVRLDDYAMEVVPEGDLFLYANDDRPGILGQVGTLLGAAGVNIAQAALGRDRSGGLALAVLNTDEAVPEAVAARVEGIPGVRWTRRVRL